MLRPLGLATSLMRAVSAGLNQYLKERELFSQRDASGVVVCRSSVQRAALRTWRRFQGMVCKPGAPLMTSLNPFAVWRG